MELHTGCRDATFVLGTISLDLLSCFSTLVLSIFNFGNGDNSYHVSSVSHALPWVPYIHTLQSNDLSHSGSYCPHFLRTDISFFGRLSNLPKATCGVHLENYELRFYLQSGIKIVLFLLYRGTYEKTLLQICLIVLTFIG